MEITFFSCSREAAIGVSAIDDLPCEPAGESVRIGSMGVLTALGQAVCSEVAGKPQPLRDATCQSFPVFEFATNVQHALAALADDRIDEIAEQWLADPSWQGVDIDLHETASLLVDIRDALQDAPSPDAALFVLLEEKAV